MDTLYSWSAKRSGASITVTHSCGQLTGIESITIHGNEIIATQNAKHQEIRQFRLHVPAGENPTGHALKQMRKPDA